MILKNLTWVPTLKKQQIGSMLLSWFFIIIERMKKVSINNKRLECCNNEPLEVKEIKPQVLSLLSANPRF